MVNYYDELEIEDFVWDPSANVFHYPCPCGDRFEISKAQLRNGEEIATCPSCSLIVRVVYDYLDWEDYLTTDDESESETSAHAQVESSPDPDTPPSPITTAHVPEIVIEPQSLSILHLSKDEGIGIGDIEGESDGGQDRGIHKATSGISEEP